VVCTTSSSKLRAQQGVVLVQPPKKQESWPEHGQPWGSGGQPGACPHARVPTCELRTVLKAMLQPVHWEAFQLHW
jgi:hypothetical protein